MITIVSDQEMYTLEETQQEMEIIDYSYESNPVGSPESYNSSLVTNEEPRSRPAPYPKRRPGPAPKRRDSDMSPDELARVDRRRTRNREAAQRCRERRMKKVSDLESQVSKLTDDKKALVIENEALLKEIEQLKFQLTLKPTLKRETTEVEKYPAIAQLEKLEVGSQNNAPKSAIALFTPGGTFQLTPLVQTTTMFNFPAVPKTDLFETEQFEKVLSAL